MKGTKGRVVGVNSNMVSVEVDGPVSLNETGFINVGGTDLKGEVIRIRSSGGTTCAQMQIYEMTNWISCGCTAEFTGDLLSVELGPGLLGQVYDGLQNPLPLLAERSGYFLQRGVYLSPLDEERLWDFTPCVKPGDVVRAGDAVGQVTEGAFVHKIMVPFGFAGDATVRSVSDASPRRVHDIVCRIAASDGVESDISMSFRWPVRRAVTCYAERLAPVDPMVTRVRLIDTFFPVARGGTYCIPGPFGAGKTVLQHMTSRNADVDIVIIAACGERAGEVVETLTEFPELTDPKTGRSLMERTIIICNTSSMPVASREASVYTGVTLAEYYRAMGLNVLLLADSTSRWAQAMREMSGRLEEIPGEEAFPAYLESTIAAFYERAGVVRLRDGKIGSVTIGGTVSPAGGNFEEPVTQATLKVVGAFHGLSRDRSDARRYPAIDPLDSWSRYRPVIDGSLVEWARALYRRGAEANQMMRVVGEEGTSLDDFVTYLKSEFLDAVYMQQRGFDEIDGATDVERQDYMFRKIVAILGSSFNFTEKDEARAFFNSLQQAFLDMNSRVFKSAEFEAEEKKVEDLLKSAGAAQSAEVRALLAGGEV